ncbi:MAG: TetR/AcrR family transcriptional regulator [Candidatus Lokiarchaeota archaeon]|nr:TetR/AcrR family transcriptional regulator [Candidatus Lokiarchaeota archaeon]
MKKSKTKRDHNKEIILALYDLIIKKGFNDISIRDIRDKAKVALGTIYHHFPKGKPAIMKELMKYFADHINKTNEVLSSEKILDPSYLGDFALNLIKNTRKYYAYHSALTQAILSDPGLFKEYENVSTEYYQDIIVNLRNKYENFKEIPEENLLKAFKFINHTYNAFIFQHIFLQPFFESDEELARFLTKLIAYYLNSDFEILT